MADIMKYKHRMSPVPSIPSGYGINKERSERTELAFGLSHETARKGKTSHNNLIRIRR